MKVTTSSTDLSPRREGKEVYRGYVMPPVQSVKRFLAAACLVFAMTAAGANAADRLTSRDLDDIAAAGFAPKGTPAEGFASAGGHRQGERQQQQWNGQGDRAVQDDAELR